MDRLNTHCLRCEVLRNKRRLAYIHVKENDVDIPLCRCCYEDWKLEQEFLLNQEEDIYGNSSSED